MPSAFSASLPEWWLCPSRPLTEPRNEWSQASDSVLECMMCAIAHGISRQVFEVLDDVDGACPLLATQAGFTFALSKCSGPDLFLEAIQRDAEGWQEVRPWRESTKARHVWLEVPCQVITDAFEVPDQFRRREAEDAKKTHQK